MSALPLLDAKYAVGLLWPALGAAARVSVRVEKEPVARESQGVMSEGEVSKEGLVRRLVGVHFVEGWRGVAWAVGGIVDVVIVVRMRRRVGVEENMFFSSS